MNMFMESDYFSNFYYIQNIQGHMKELNLGQKAFIAAAN